MLKASGIRDLALGSVYTGPGPFRTNTKLVRISLVLHGTWWIPGTNRICYLIPDAFIYKAAFTRHRSRSVPFGLDPL